MPSTRSASSFLNEEVVEEVEAPQKPKRTRKKKVE